MDHLAKEYIISAYSRQEAIVDGLLIDVTDIAQRAGICYPVAVSRRLWFEYINHTEPLGRLWEMLWVFKLKAIHEDSDMLSFNMSFTGADGNYQLVNLWAICGPGDLGEEVITIMLPDDY